ncbi:MAG TPA: substrate-binding domain-containing protein [Methylophilaceae bacterium]|nr:substrate-binding domain-containing protein [Methylophilaceae bacterium]
MQHLKQLLQACLLLLAFSTSAAADDAIVRLATTTSTANSGLLDYLLPKFEQHCRCKVHVIAVGTGKALKLGEDGNVDVVLVHARAAEDAFVASGHGIDRRDVMYNDFVLIGPPEDPARIKGEKDVVHAMQKIAHSHAKFVSRGDDSGTDKMEKHYWQQAGMTAGADNEPRWYFSAGQGMGEVLTMSAEKRAYTLTDRGTYVSYRDKLDLPILLEGDARMFNPYGIIAVNPKKYPEINYQGATALIDWMTSEPGQALIASFKVEGEQLFTPSAHR